MKQMSLIVLVLALLLGASAGDARNTRHQLPIEVALERGDREGVLNSSIRLYFGDEEHPAVDTRLGTFTSNKKTNAFGKSDESACEWAFLGAMKSLQERAVREGGNAVVNIHSFYFQSKFVSATEYECGAGATVAGVTMIGEVVKLAE